MTEDNVWQCNKTCHFCGVGFYAKQRKRYCSRACKVAQFEKDAPGKFWAKVDKNGPNGCWLYMGFRKWDGYGWLARYFNGKVKHLTAHRYAWILTHGEPEKGLSIMHLCDVPACCNPSHLKLGTHADNMADAVSKGRSAYGERNRRNKLTAAQAEEIKSIKPVRGIAAGLARRFGVGVGCITAIWRGETWRITAPSKVLHPDRVRPERKA
jgi:hypothetical protein